VRVMSRGGWDVGIKNASGNYLMESMSLRDENI
jgi:hypothetical protein